MILFICAQDIKFFWFGLIKDDSFVVLEKIEGAPEDQLKFLDEFLKKNSIAVDQITKISVVLGPGSFTANRIGITIANAMHFTKSIPIFVLENPNHLLPEQLIKESGIGLRLAENEFAVPLYS